MNNSNPEKNPDIEEVAKYIARASHKIVNEMKKQVENHSGFEEAVQKMKDESLIEQQRYQEDFHARRSKIKGRFNRRR